MIINETELEKLCMHFYPKLFNCKDIILYDIKIKILDSLYLDADLKYYNIDTKIKAKVVITIDDKIKILLDGIIKYGFINLNLNKVFREIIKDNEYVEVREENIIIENDIIKEVNLKDGQLCIELK